MFNIEKLIQACNYLLKKNNFSLNYTKLIKLLYLADKESLKGALQTITGDTYVSMDNGPVLSQLYDLIMGRYRKTDAQNLWNSRFIRDGYNLVAATERIPQGELSKFETRILDQIYEQFKNSGVWEMIDYVHNNCPEWKDPEGSAIAIRPNEILESIGRTPEEIEWILAETSAFEEEERAFLSLSE
ncbi:MAG: SocA family protein [Treponema sp.]|jgi:uncharacterized phage-associated protein|nr:SocA family protein [Treponema sp.]